MELSRPLRVTAKEFFASSSFLRDDFFPLSAPDPTNFENSMARAIFFSFLCVKGILQILGFFRSPSKVLFFFASSK